MNLIDRIKKYSGFYNEKTSLSYVKALNNELQELQEALETKDESEILGELADVYVMGQLLAHKMSSEYGVTPEYLTELMEQKYQSRAPHMFENKYIGLKAEDDFWFEYKAKLATSEQ